MSYKACFLGILPRLFGPIVVAAVLGLFVVPGVAFAQTLQFSASLTGTQTCADFDTAKLKLTLFVSYDGTSFNVFRNSNFSSLYVSLPIFEVYQIGQGSTNTFTVGAISTDVSHPALFEGTVKISNKSFSAVGAFVDYDGGASECINYGVLSAKIQF